MQGYESPLLPMIIILMAKLNSVSLLRDLGLLTSDVLSWNLHIANITAKANSILGLIKRTCRDANDVTTLKTPYCSLARPRVEYASQVWNPYTKRNISRIKSIKLKERGEIGVVFSLNLFPRNPLIAIKTLFNKHNLSLVLI